MRSDGIVRPFLNGRAKSTDRTVQIDFLVEDKAQIAMSFGHCRAGRNCGAERSNGGIQIAKLVERASHEMVRLRILFAISGDELLTGFNNAAQIARVVERSR